MTKIQKYFEDFILNAIKTQEHLEVFLNSSDIRKKFREEELTELRNLFIWYHEAEEITNVHIVEQEPELEEFEEVTESDEIPDVKD